MQDAHLISKGMSVENLMQKDDHISHNSKLEETIARLEAKINSLVSMIPELNQQPQPPLHQPQPTTLQCQPPSLQPTLPQVNVLEVPPVNKPTTFASIVGSGSAQQQNTTTGPQDE